MSILSLLPFQQANRSSNSIKTRNVREEKAHICDILRPLHHELLTRLPGAAIQLCAKKLGISSKGVIVLDNENEMIVLSDYCIYNFRPVRRNVVEDYLAETTPEHDSDKMKILQAMASALYSIFEVMEVERGMGIHMRDALFGMDVFVTDYYFSHSLIPGFLIAGRILPLPEINIFSGAALPIDEEILEDAQQWLESRYLNGPISPEMESRLAAYIIRLALAQGMASHVGYV